MSPVGKLLPKGNSLAWQRLGQLLILLAAGCLTTMTGGVVSPVLPEMIDQLHLDREWAGMLVSAHALTSAAATPLMGILADRVGKLKVMIPCLILYAVFGVATAFMTTFPLLLATRGLLGAASGGVAAATIGILGGMYEGEARSRILGYATSAMTTSAILFPLLGGVVGGINWQYAFYLYGLGIPLAALAATNFQEQTGRSSSLIGTGEQSQLRTVLLKPAILKIYLFLLMAAAIVYAVVIYTPLYLSDVIDAGPELNGFVLAIRAVGAAVIAAVGASRLGRRLGQNRAVAFGFSLMAMTLLTIPFLTELYFIIPTAVLFGVGFGVITPNLYDVLAGLAPADLRASVLAIGTGFNSLGQFFCPIIMGLVLEKTKPIGLPAVFYAAATIAMIASFLSLMHDRQVQLKA
ncbi:MAG: MFS transporter [Cyanobacteria bacterium RU_5_0]|nr:MFS transporter [Cyanobacteria bacterium RU_5_0]